MSKLVILTDLGERMTNETRAVSQEDLVNAASFVRKGLALFGNSLARIDLDETALQGALDLMTSTELPVVCSGVGKSGFIAAKLVATLNSLGVRAAYLNPTDALHGDLGAVADKSVVILISNSGRTTELRNLIPSLQSRECKIISLVSSGSSPLAKVATHVLSYGAVDEVDEHGLAPTTSTVVQLAMADALAAAVSRARRFKPNDFYRNHPAGALGKRLMKVDALMRRGDHVPKVTAESTMIETLGAITAKHVGCTCVIDAGGRLVGLITDGDIRRELEKRVDIYATTASEIMQTQPQTAQLGDYVEQMLKKHEYLDRHFTVPVIDTDRTLYGLLVSIDLI